jgi:hypothetical protein
MTKIIFLYTTSMDRHLFISGAIVPSVLVALLHPLKHRNANTLHKNYKYEVIHGKYAFHYSIAFGNIFLYLFIYSTCKRCRHNVPFRITITKTRLKILLIF